MMKNRRLQLYTSLLQQVNLFFLVLNHTVQYIQYILQGHGDIDFPSVGYIQNGSFRHMHKEYLHSPHQMGFHLLNPINILS